MTTEFFVALVLIFCDLFPILLLIGILVAIFTYSVKKRKRFLDEYRETDYYQITHNDYKNVIGDKGKNGEYKMYKYLVGLVGHKKFLFNLYIPSENGKTTEIDMVMIHTSGIYVFESKNYRGWIFGSENQHEWTQCIKQGRKSVKYRFYNPISQNKTHIFYLKKILAQFGEMPIYSYVVFGDESTLKKVSVVSPDCKVAKANEIFSVVCNHAHQAGEKISYTAVDELYNFLLPFTQVSEETKNQHIRDVSSLSADFNN